MAAPFLDLLDQMRARRSIKRNRPREQLKAICGPVDNPVGCSDVREIIMSKADQLARLDVEMGGDSLDHHRLPLFVRPFARRRPERVAGIDRFRIVG